MISNFLQHLRRRLLPLGLTVSLLLAGGLVWLNQTSTVSANGSDFSLAESTYPTIVGSRIDNCSLCHTSVPSLNPFGAAYKAGGRGLASSLTNIANVDSDGDGFTNIVEINAHTYPGDKLDFPAVTPTSAPTATSTSAPTATATKAPTATSTSVSYPPPPTATNPAPTATKPGPTATKPAPTATKPGPTATKPGPTATKPAVTATKRPRMTATPGVGPTPVTQCVPDDDGYRQRVTQREKVEGHKRPNPCPPDFHDRRDHGDLTNNDGGNFFQNIWDQITAWISKRRP